MVPPPKRSSSPVSFYHNAFTPDPTPRDKPTLGDGSPRSSTSTARAASVKSVSQASTSTGSTIKASNFNKGASNGTLFSSLGLFRTKTSGSGGSNSSNKSARSANANEITSVNPSLSPAAQYRLLQQEQQQGTTPKDGRAHSHLQLGASVPFPLALATTGTVAGGKTPYHANQHPSLVNSLVHDDLASASSLALQNLMPASSSSSPSQQYPSSSPSSYTFPPQQQQQHHHLARRTRSTSSFANPNILLSSASTRSSRISEEEDGEDDTTSVFLAELEAAAQESVPAWLAFSRKELVDAESGSRQSPAPLSFLSAGSVYGEDARAWSGGEGTESQRISRVSVGGDVEQRRRTVSQRSSRSSQSRVPSHLPSPPPSMVSFAGTKPLYSPTYLSPPSMGTGIPRKDSNTSMRTSSSFTSAVPSSYSHSTTTNTTAMTALTDDDHSHKDRTSRRPWMFTSSSSSSTRSGHSAHSGQSSYDERRERKRSLPPATPPPSTPPPPVPSSLYGDEEGEEYGGGRDEGRKRDELERRVKMLEREARVREEQLSGLLELVHELKVGKK